MPKSQRTKIYDFECFGQPEKVKRWSFATGQVCMRDMQTWGKRTAVWDWWTGVKESRARLRDFNR